RGQAVFDLRDRHLAPLSCSDRKRRGWAGPGDLVLPHAWPCGPDTFEGRPVAYPREGASERIAEPGAAPDRGGTQRFQGYSSLQPPRRVSFTFGSGASVMQMAEKPLMSEPPDFPLWRRALALLLLITGGLLVCAATAAETIGRSWALPVGIVGGLVC